MPVQIKITNKVKIKGGGAVSAVWFRVFRVPLSRLESELIVFGLHGLGGNVSVLQQESGVVCRPFGLCFTQQEVADEELQPLA